MWRAATAPGAAEGNFSWLEASTTSGEPGAGDTVVGFANLGAPIGSDVAPLVITADEANAWLASKGYQFAELVPAA